SREDWTVIAFLSSANIQDATVMLKYKNQMEQARSDFSGLRNAIFEIDDDGDLYKVKYEFTDLDKSDNEILRYRVAKFFGLSYEEDEMLYYEDLEKSLTDAGYSHS
ncbi:MAG: hypothetical protein IJ519_03805, partial [Clostridia bacterium]|nr:hypothetical protein [Clostridia bacterium]